MSPPHNPIHSFLLFCKKIKLNKNNNNKGGKGNKRELVLWVLGITQSFLLWQPVKAQRVTEGGPGRGEEGEERAKHGKRGLRYFPLGWNSGVSQKVPITVSSRARRRGTKSRRGRQEREEAQEARKKRGGEKNGE